MKTLFLIRHAKSSWDDFSIKDIDRPLNERGKKSAPIMGKILADSGLDPDVMISSPAKRAFSTAKRIAKELDYEKDYILKEPSIYDAEVKDLLHLVNGLKNEWKTVILIGHNPGFTEFCNYLSGSDLQNIPTCGVAKIELPTKDWKMVSRDSGHLAWFDFPKNHGDF